MEKKKKVIYWKNAEAALQIRGWRKQPRLLETSAPEICGPFLYSRGPQPPGHGVVLVRGLLGTGPHSRRWEAVKWAKLYLYLQPLPIARITACQHYGELYNYFIIRYNVIIKEIKHTINVMSLNHPETIPPPPSPWKKCLPQSRSLEPKRLGTTALEHCH